MGGDPQGTPRHEGLQWWGGQGGPGYAMGMNAWAWGLATEGGNPQTLGFAMGDTRDNQA